MIPAYTNKYLTAEQLRFVKAVEVTVYEEAKAHGAAQKAGWKTGLGYRPSVAGRTAAETAEARGYPRGGFGHRAGPGSRRPGRSSRRRFGG